MTGVVYNIAAGIGITVAAIIILALILFHHDGRAVATCYRFTPRPDIDTYTLAQIVAHTDPRALMAYDSKFAAQPESIRRNFTETPCWGK